MTKSEPHENVTCGATTRKGTPCQLKPMANGRCFLHGGRSLSGPAHPNWKHGRRSKFLPKDLRQRYEEALNDPNLSDLTEDLALIESRINLLMEQLETGGSARLWTDLNTAWRGFLQAMSGQDENDQRLALQAVGQLISRGDDQGHTWGELYALIEQRRRLSESKQRIAVQAQQVIAIDMVLAMLAGLVAAVKASVYEHTDTDTARRIIVDTSAAYRDLLGPGSNS